MQNLKYVPKVLWGRKCTQRLLDPKDTSVLLWWRTLNANITFMLLVNKETPQGIFNNVCFDLTCSAASSEHPIPITNGLPIISLSPLLTISTSIEKSQPSYPWILSPQPPLALTSTISSWVCFIRAAISFLFLLCLSLGQSRNGQGETNELK